MIAFQPKGPLLSFTGATSAPTAVQAISLTGETAQQYLLTNTDAAIDCVVGWGATAAEAAKNAAAAASVQNCYYLLHSTQIVVTGPRDAYFSGITGSSTAVVKVQNGIGN
jgi:hypothetical protein